MGNEGFVKGFAGDCRYGQGGCWGIKILSRRSLGSEVNVKGVAGVCRYGQVGRYRMNVWSRGSLGMKVWSRGLVRNEGMVKGVDGE